MNESASHVQTALASMLDQHASGDLVLRSGLHEHKNTRRAAHLVLPSVLENMGNFSRSPDGLAILRDSLARTSGNIDQSDDCRELAVHLFGGRLPRAAEQLGNRAGISPKAAVATLEAMSGWVLTNLGTLVEDPRDPDALGRLLIDHGGSGYRAARTSSTQAEQGDLANSATLAQPDNATNADPLAVEQAPRSVMSPDDDQLVAPPKTKTSRKLLGAGIVVVLLALAAVAGFLFLRGSSTDVATETSLSTASDVAAESYPAQASAEPTDADDETSDASASSSQAAEATDTETDSTAAAAPISDPAEAEPAARDEASEDEASAEPVDPAIMVLSVPMRDIGDVAPDAQGLVDFTFNTVTGEICFEVGSLGVTPPYAAHIHAGSFGVKGGVVVDLGSLQPDATGCVANLPADTLAILADPAGHYAELHDASGEWTVRGQLSETVDNPGVVSLAVPMVDITGVEPTAEGTLNFAFDTVTGEVCYDVTSVNVTAPFASHIHAGEFGIKGGVVVDLGELEDGSGGCVDNALSDTLAILADPAGHYAELHDASGDWTIRGQLSVVSNAVDANTADPVVDTDGGGAIVRLQEGIIYLEGAVSEQSVADEMVASLEGTSTQVVNNLTIVTGSPLPSGRVVIGDNIFFDSGSDRIKDLDLGTVTALVELANSRPDWIMTVVGHTDDIGTEVVNLELSLLRAQALRNVLIAQGMNGDNMRIRGAGETAPIGDNSTEEGRALNRRIEFEFTPA